MDRVVETLNENWKLEGEERNKALEEKIWHNCKMENNESKKASISVYDLIEKSMNRFLSSEIVFHEPKGTIPLQHIAQALSSCIKCFNFASMIQQDREKFASWYIRVIGLIQTSFVKVTYKFHFLDPSAVDQRLSLNFHGFVAKLSSRPANRARNRQWHRLEVLTYHWTRRTART